MQHSREPREQELTSFASPSWPSSASRDCYCCPTQRCAHRPVQLVVHLDGCHQWPSPVSVQAAPPGLRQGSRLRTAAGCRLDLGAFVHNVPLCAQRHRDRVHSQKQRHARNFIVICKPDVRILEVATSSYSIMTRSERLPQQSEPRIATFPCHSSISLSPLTAQFSSHSQLKMLTLDPSLSRSDAFVVALALFALFHLGSWAIELLTTPSQPKDALKLRSLPGSIPFFHERSRSYGTRIGCTISSLSTPREVTACLPSGRSWVDQQPLNS